MSYKRRAITPVAKTRKFLAINEALPTESGWMREIGITATKIGTACGHRTHAVASNTIAGRQNNRLVLQYLIDKGCPARYLDLPKDMKEAA